MKGIDAASTAVGVRGGPLGAGADAVSDLAAGVTAPVRDGPTRATRAARWPPSSSAWRREGGAWVMSYSATLDDSYAAAVQ